MTTSEVHRLFVERWKKEGTQWLLSHGLKKYRSDLEKAYNELQRERSETMDPWKHRKDTMRCMTCMWYAAKVPATDSPAPYIAYNPDLKVPPPTISSPPMVRQPIGRCRRHAPTMSGFPVVYPADWCGDHKLDEEKL